MEQASVLVMGVGFAQWGWLSCWPGYCRTLTKGAREGSSVPLPLWLFGGDESSLILAPPVLLPGRAGSSCLPTPQTSKGAPHSGSLSGLTSPFCCFSRGARHGITMRAKLARLEEQEKAFLASSVQRQDGPGTAPSGWPDPQHSSQAKKHKRSKTGGYREEPAGGSCLKAKPKKKKKKKTANGKELNGH